MSVSWPRAMRPRAYASVSCSLPPSPSPGVTRRMRTTLTMVEAASLCAVALACGFRAPVPSGGRADTTVRGVSAPSIPVRRTSVAGSAMGIIGSTIVTLAIGYVASIVLARSLGPSGRGLVAVIQSDVVLVVALAGLGTPTAITYFASRRERIQPALSGFALIYAGGLAALAALGVLLVGGWLADNQGRASISACGGWGRHSSRSCTTSTSSRACSTRGRAYRKQNMAQHPRARGHARRRRSRSSRGSAGASPAG